MITATGVGTVYPSLPRACARGEVVGVREREDPEGGGMPGCTDSRGRGSRGIVGGYMLLARVSDACQIVRCRVLPENPCGGLLRGSPIQG
jgi:hypothetical protein